MTLEMIPLCVPEMTGNEGRYLNECVDTGWVSSVGAFVDRFERETAALVGVPHAVATTSGTAALHVALLVAGVRPDDEVLVSSLTFVAPANAIRYVGAWPIFVDAEPAYYQLDVNLVRDFLKHNCEGARGCLRNKRTGRRVSCLLPVHVLGHPLDFEPLRALADEYGLVIVEDATEALGTTTRGRNAGALGDIACLSFNGNKLITTGGGGMFLTAREDWAKRARYLTTQAKDDEIEFVHGAVGFNYRLTNIQAAVGCAQLGGIERFIAKKRAIAARYAEAIAGIEGITLMPEAPWAKSVFWMYTVLVDEQRYGMSSRGLQRALAVEKIQTRPVWQPLHQSPAHQPAVVLGGEVAERINQTALSLPCSVGLTDAQQARVIDTLRRLRKA